MRVSSERMNRVMDEIHPHFTMRATLSFLLLLLLQTSAEAQICDAPDIVEFNENMAAGSIVIEITVQPGVTVEFAPPPANPNNPFVLEGNVLKAGRMLDYEAQPNYPVDLLCNKTFPRTFVVVIINLNDNKPTFDQNPYNIEVNEMEPVGTTVQRFAATDLDRPSVLYYTLTPNTTNFALASTSNPSLIVRSALDYDTVKNVQLLLEVEDRQDGIKYSATTTINISILDGDNRPPWFQPCTEYNLGGIVICQNTGYTGRVNLSEQVTGVLPLKPGPLYALDGDSGINAPVTYSFVGETAGNLFAIDPNTGNITMQKGADVLGEIKLTVMAVQRTNINQFATTSVSISVQVASNNPPRFEKAQYEGVVSSVGAMATDPNNNDEPLQIFASDEDYASVGGVNPMIRYYVNGSSDFSIIGGYLFMIKDVPDATLSLEVVAVDTSNDQTGTATLVVEVRTGLTTTSLPLSTEASTTDLTMSTDIQTTQDNASTTNPSTSTDIQTTQDIASTTDPTMSTSISTILPSTTAEMIISSGVYGLMDMGVLGGTLGALLFICMVVIGVLAYRIYRGKTNWRKIYETTRFQSSLGGGSSADKKCIQYTNEAFEKDEEGGSTGSSGSEGRKVTAGGELSAYQNFLLRQSTAVQDDGSMTGSDKADSDKEVKPILTKERRMEDGYKSVWFKEDIDPNAKEEVVIIPDSREDDSDDEDNNEPAKIPKVGFADTDLDSGLGVKMGDPAEDSEDNEMVNIQL